MLPEPIRTYLATIGGKGGRARSERKTNACRANGLKPKLAGKVVRAAQVAIEQNGIVREESK